MKTIFNFFGIIVLSITTLLVFSLSTPLFGQDKSQMKKTHFYNAQVKMDTEGKSPSSIRFQEGKQPTVATFFEEYRQFFPMSEENQMEALRVSNNKIGAHHRFNQYYKGIEIIGAQFILHEKNGAVWSANGKLVPELKLDVNPKISEQAALQAALQNVNADVYMWQNPGNEEFIKKEQNDVSATFIPKGELKLTSGNEEIISDNIKLVYRFDIYAEKPLGRYWVDVDANTGEIVNKLSRLHNDVDETATNTTLYNGPQSITVNDDGFGTFTTQENTTRAASILTYDAHHTTNLVGSTLFSAASSTGFTDAVGVSVHWGAEATYDYYFDNYDRNSLDDAGFSLLSYGHFGNSIANAYWDGARMLYGDGNGTSFTPLVGLDVCGHELTHGVTQFTSGLIYSNESGGLNESFSDIFGNLVEFSKEGDPGPNGNGWRIGEEITTNGLGIRNMANPNEFNDPDTYLGTYWVNEVHTTSGVQNFWFYLLTEGGSGTNDNGHTYSVTGIGLVAAAAIAYHNNTSFLIPSSNYNDARNGAIACAEALFGVGSQQALSTANAWDAVGVYYIAPPANDDIADAIAVACGSTTAGTTIGATFDADAPSCDFAHTTDGVWYTLVGTGDLIIASMCGGPIYDSRMTVYEGSPGSLVCVGADDDACGVASVSEVTWASTLGTTYYILVHGWGSAVGSFELTLTCLGPPATALVGVCYASTGRTDGGRLLTIDPLTGAGTLIGPTGLIGVPGLAINSSGEIFGTERSSGDLFRIDAVTGEAFLVGGTGVTFLDAIAFDENDVLYGIGFDPPSYNLRIIDTQTGISTTVGPTGDAITGMAFDPTDGQLYGSFGGFDAINPDNIAQIDKTTGTVTYIGTTGIGGPTPDLCFDGSGNLYGSKGGGSHVNDLISINKSNGTGTVIGPIGVSSVSGMASFVGDITPPVITVADPLSLWPANHKYETIDIAQCIISVEDDVDGSIPVSDVVIEIVSSDEPDNASGNGDGNTINDMVIDSDCKSVDLRRERQGNGNGRVYTIHVSVSDAAGNVATANCLVTVPHDKNGTAIDDGPVNTVVSDCAESLAKFISNISEQENNLSSTVPENFALEQNYPNPFNPSTVIRYALPENAKVSLVVYDILGSQVAELVNGNIAAGIYEVAFDATNLTSGIYFYRLTAGSFTQINKMILLK